MKEIYLDAHASTPLDSQVLESMMPYFNKYYGNGNHRNGWKVASALEAARCEVAAAIGAYPNEIYFTSGATEAINTGIIGLSRLKPEKKHIITQVTEHPAVLETFRFLEIEGYKVTYLNVDFEGQINLDELAKSISDETLLVAVMLSNNEIGTVHPIETIGKICKAKNTSLFCDLTQAISWYDIDVHKLNIDLACISAHKIYGPRGSGALYSRFRSLPPLMHGGGQERGLRSGTVNVPGAVGLGKACALCLENKEQDVLHIKRTRDFLLSHLMENLLDVTINGSKMNRHPGNINLQIKGVESDQLIGRLPNLIFSNSSACEGGSKASHVLTSIGLNDRAARESFRVGISKNNKLEDVGIAAKQICEAVTQIRNK